MREFNIIDYGAYASQTVLQTEFIQRAIDDCFLQGGGIVVVPKGTYLMAGIRLRSNTTLYLQTGAILLGSRNPKDYFTWENDTVEPVEPQYITQGRWHIDQLKQTQYVEDDPLFDFMRKPCSPWNYALIRAQHAENIAIEGEPGSIIDGNDCYDPLGEEGYRGPHGIFTFECKNISISGYTLQNSSNWAHFFLNSENIKCNNIIVKAGHDGIHFRGCRNIDVRDSEFYTGDDSAAGFANVDVIFSNCKLNSACSAFRFGGTNVLIEKCHMFGPGRFLYRGSMTLDEKINGKPTPDTADTGHRKNMLSAFTYHAEFSLPIKERPENIVVKDCLIENADRFLHYNLSGNESWQKGRPLGDITFENIKATGIKLPMTAYGAENDPLELTLKNVEIVESPDFVGDALIRTCHYKRIILENVKLENLPCKSLVKRWSKKGEIKFQNVSCNLEQEDYICDAEEKFYTVSL